MSLVGFRGVAIRYPSLLQVIVMRHDNRIRSIRVLADRVCRETIGVLKDERVSSVSLASLDWLL